MQTDSKPFELRVLGSTELRGPSGETMPGTALTPKRLALLAYLAVEAADGFRRRDQIVGLFWPELPQDAARTQLRKAIAAIRETLGADVVRNRGEGELRLDPERLWCDAAALAEHAANRRPADALALYRGEFLDGLFPEGVGQDFHEWLSAKRKSLRDLAASAAWACARMEEDRGDRGAAAVMARRALSLTPDDEEGVRRLMAILDRHGDRAGALRVYADWQQRLRAEYGVEPAPETRKLARRVQAARKGESHETPPTEPALTAYLSQPAPAVQPVLRPRYGRRLAVAAAALAVVLIGIAAMARDAPPPPESIALLPLRAIGDSPDFVSALTEEITTSLAQNRLVVRSPSLAGLDPMLQARRAGQALRVEYVVDGGVQRGKGQLRVTLRLVRTRDGIVQWAGSYDVEEASAPTGVRDVAADAVRRIRAHVPSR
jgi:DNA-binding SARP family transcriptional activator/TolB-like protein